MEIREINKRYSELSGTDCCLSCGGAINYTQAKSGETCVDLGSGRGTDVLRLAEEVGEKGFVFGIDVSDGMIDKAKKNALKFNVNNVRFVKCELESTPLPDSTVDLVISNCTLNHVSNKQAVWDEIFRMLKSGGRFVISDIYAVDPIAEEYKNDPVAVAECWAGAVTRTEYFSHILNAGFTSFEVLEESAPYEKGKAVVASITLSGSKSINCCCGH
jgi:ubiquinone/menaquinone biosynthesis C-methylase UbiE